MRPADVHEHQDTMLMPTSYIIIFRDNNHSSPITWSLWEGQCNLQEIFQFSSLTEEGRRKPRCKGRKDFPAQLLEHEACLFSPSFLQLWQESRVTGKHRALLFLGNISSLIEPPTGTETGASAIFVWEGHLLQVPRLLQPNQFPSSLFTCA